MQDHLLVHMEGLLIKPVLNGRYPPHCFGGVSSITLRTCAGLVLGGVVGGGPDLITPRCTPAGPHAHSKTHTSVAQSYITHRLVCALFENVLFTLESHTNISSFCFWVAARSHAVVLRSPQTPGERERAARVEGASSRNRSGSHTTDAAETDKGGRSEASVHKDADRSSVSAQEY